jgi:hypothetical protein
VNQDIEERLLGLRPAEPPAEFMERLVSSEPSAPGKIRWVLFIGPLAAAAAVAAFMALPLLRPRQPAKPQPVAASDPPASDFRVFVPIEQTSTLLDVHNVAVIDVDPSRPIRLIRATWLDDITYTGDDGRSTMHRREPRTEIVSIPLDTL